jgi:RNA polymerase sigma-70 factor (ECF subfamily)
LSIRRFDHDQNLRQVKNIKPGDDLLEENQTEGRTIEQAVLGDPAAFARLADAYRPALNQMARRYLKNSDDANDVVQETLFKALRSIHEFDPRRPFKPWLYRICSNCCVDSVRLKRREPQTLDEQDSVPSTALQVDDQVGGNLLRHQLLEAIAHLPSKYRHIVLMRHVRQMEVSEIAQELKTPEGTIKSWLFRARALLKKELTPAFG